MVRGNLRDMEGEIPYNVSVNKPCDIIHNEISYWTDEKSLGMSPDMHFTMLKTWRE
jgi:hypothetical protein